MQLCSITQRLEIYLILPYLLVRKSYTMSARIGRKIFATAVFDATSVTPAVIMHTTNRITKGGKAIIPANCLPIQSDNPDFLVASDKAYPPPVKCYRLIKGQRYTSSHRQS